MTSVRLHHPQFKSSADSRLTYAVELADHPMPKGHVRACNACSQPPDKLVVHGHKTIHLRLDENGDTYVSPEILALLRTVPGTAGLEVSGAVGAPPQYIGAVEQAKQEVILPNGRHYVPGLSKEDATARMRRPFQPMVEAIREQQDRAATAKRMEKASTFIFGRRK